MPKFGNHNWRGNEKKKKGPWGPNIRWRTRGVMGSRRVGQPLPLHFINPPVPVTLRTMVLYSNMFKMFMRISEGNE